MGVGAIELAFVVLVFPICAALAASSKRKWLAVIPFFFLVAAVTSPADPASMLIIGVPNVVVFAFAFCRLSPKRTVA